jgi:hypothetical protein
MALTTVKPSAGSPILRSEIRTSKGSALIMARASGTVAAVVTLKPLFSRMAGSIKRMLGSSSTNKIRYGGIALTS